MVFKWWIRRNLRRVKIPVFDSFLLVYWWVNRCSLFFFLQGIYLFFVFTATPVAYGRSQGRQQMGTAASGCSAATAALARSRICKLHCSLWQHQILNPRSKARDRTLVLTETTSILLVQLSSLIIQEYIHVCVCVLFSSILLWHSSVCVCV